MTNDPRQGDFPTENVGQSHGDGALNVPASLAHRAASISCRVSLAVYVLGAASTLSPLLWAFVLIIDFAAFGLGMVGIIGGVNRRATATIRMGACAVLRSGIPLAALLVRVFVRLSW